MGGQPDRLELLPSESLGIYGKGMYWLPESVKNTYGRFSDKMQTNQFETVQEIT